MSIIMPSLILEWLEMSKQLIISAIIAVLTATMFLFNKKVSLIRLFVRQVQVFKNGHTGKFSIWDLMCFVAFPIIISILIVYGFPYHIDAKLAEILTTVFSLVFTILFGFAAVIVEKSESNNVKRKIVVEETFISIVTSTALSLFAAIISIMLVKVTSELIVSILSAILLSLSISITMLLLMITKRTFVIYCEDKEE